MAVAVVMVTKVKDTCTELNFPCGKLCVAFIPEKWISMITPQWRSRLARRTYKQYQTCEGREFEPPLGKYFYQHSFFILLHFYAMQVTDKYSISYSIS